MGLLYINSLKRPKKKKRRKKNSKFVTSRGVGDEESD
jgi:hypothetical protein